MQSLLISKVHTAFKMISSYQCCDTEQEGSWEGQGTPLTLALGVEVGGEPEASLGWEWRFSTSPVEFLDLFTHSVIFGIESCCVA